MTVKTLIKHLQKYPGTYEVCLEVESERSEYTARDDSSFWIPAIELSSFHFNDNKSRVTLSLGKEVNIYPVFEDKEE